MCIRDRRKYTREIDSADIVVSGIPFDMATSNRPGARFGPRALRAASVGLAELDAYPFGFDPFDFVAVADYGDCYIDYGYLQNATDLIHKKEYLQAISQLNEILKIFPNELNSIYLLISNFPFFARIVVPSTSINILSELSSTSPKIL